MKTSSSTSFAVASRQASALDSKSNQKGHNRLESRPHSFVPSGVEPIISSSTRSSVDPPRNGTKRISLASDSKDWSKHQKAAPKSTYDRILQIAFIICLMFFLRALSGSGVPPDSITDSATMPHARVYASRIARPGGQTAHTKIFEKEHNHLAIDLDGHYSVSIEFDDVRARVWNQWGNRAMEDAAATPGVKEQDSDSGEEIEGIPEPTPYNNFENTGITDSPHTPPPVTPPITIDGADVVHVETELDVIKAEAGMDLPLFMPDDPAYALRIHLPTTKSVIDEHRHGRKRRARGEMIH